MVSEIFYALIFVQHAWTFSGWSHAVCPSARDQTPKRSVLFFCRQSNQVKSVVPTPLHPGARWATQMLPLFAAHKLSPDSGGSAGRRGQSFHVWRRRELASITLAACSLLICTLMVENSRPLNCIEKLSGEIKLVWCSRSHSKVCFQSLLFIDPQ